MKLHDLSKFDPSIKLVKNSEWPEEILAISSLDALTSGGMIFIKNAKFLQKLVPVIDQAVTLKVGAVVDEKFFNLVNAELKAELDKLPWIATSNQVPMSLTLLSKPFYDQKMKGVNTQVDGRQMGTTDIHPSAHIAQNVFIGENVKIGANVEIMPGSVILSFTEIGDDTRIFPNVTIYPFTKIGKSCRIHASSVIGSDGFGYTFHQGQHVKIWHMGGVIIHDNVEIGSNSSVDMGTFSPTIIGAGTRIDNFVQVAHNCKIGKGCVLCGHVGLAGSVTLEDYVVLGGKAGVGPDAHIGMGTQIAGAAMVNEGVTVPAGSKLGGHPAKDLREWMKGVAYLRMMSLKETK
ncbi:UDP-3-O-(3-hydroxymyristoyl)glucosamine N-acyltransferase [Peredibacter sp. HCB2-198]|uniref:UDP-3-O-(3-hydroxymyristoyl)glucosamine N-acyltransferase n=1 Tax=Peredibacter sp. HCB2-198 TaxID=3383025 RepID=UPI0038B5C190